MGRKRINLGPDAEARIAVMMARGDNAEAIAKSVGASQRTVERRMTELRGAVATARADSRSARRPPQRAVPRLPLAPPTAGGDADDVDVAIPDGSTVEEIDRWLRVAEEEAKLAAGDEDPDNHIKWVRIVTSLIEAKRKAKPIPKVDPNDRPDMVEAAARVRKRWHALAENLVRVANSPLADSIGRLVHGE